MKEVIEMIMGKEIKMSGNNMQDRDIRFEIVENIGVIASYPTGWSKELNMVSWNGGAVKYDIRDWDPGHEHMSRGVTLHEKEMRAIIELLRKRRFYSDIQGNRESEAE